MEKVGSERAKKKKKGLGNSRKDKSVFIRLKNTSSNCGYEREVYRLWNGRNWVLFSDKFLVEALRPQSSKTPEVIGGWNNRGINNAALHMILISQVTPCGVCKSPGPDSKHKQILGVSLQ